MLKANDVGFSDSYGLNSFNQSILTTMKFNLFPVSIVAFAGFSVLSAGSANAAVLFSVGTENHFLEEEHFEFYFASEGIIGDFELSLIGLELTTGTSLFGTISQENTEIETTEFEVTSSGDFTKIFSDFNGQDRSGNFIVSLRAEANDETAPNSPEFNVSYLKAAAREDGLVCDEIKGTLTDGSDWENVSCYFPKDLQTVGDETFIPLVSNAGVIANRPDELPTLAYQDPTGIATVSNGSRITRAQGNSVASSIDVIYTLETCSLANPNYSPITGQCNGPDGLNINGHLVFTQDESSEGLEPAPSEETFQIAVASGETTGFQPVPEPSLVVGFLTLLGVASRKKLF